MARAPLPRQWHVDTDNALGSPWGDVDDGLALLWLVASAGKPPAGGLPGQRLALSGVSVVAGNTSAELARINTQALFRRLGFGSSVDRQIAAAPPGATLEVSGLLALGPLSNVAQAVGSGRSGGRTFVPIVVVGGSLASRGQWPPVWPLEFNFTRDRAAAAAVFASGAPIVVVPLDVARRFRLGASDFRGVGGELGRWLLAASRHWRMRSLVMRGSGRFPAFDVVAAALAVAPELVTLEPALVMFEPRGWLRWGAGRDVRRVVAIDLPGLRQRWLADVGELAARLLPAD